MKGKERRNYYLVSQEEIYKIDCLIGALNLALTEILEARPVREPEKKFTHAQDDYDRRIGEVIYRDNLSDHF